jgi:parallel beta-helix repeat protein
VHQKFATVVIVLACGLLGKSLEAPATEPGPPRTFWVAVDGQPDADGSPDNPLDLATALSGDGPVRAGDTVWVRGGTYRGSFSSTLSGTAEAPIVVRQVPGQRVTIDSAGSGRDALSIGGRDTWFWGFEITSSDPNRRTSERGSWPADLQRGYGAVTRAPGIRLINLVVHDNANGLGVWSESIGSDLYGNLVYSNGWQAPDRAHGHGIYTQNQRGTRHLADNIVFNQFSHGIHAYGSEQAHLDNITLEGNIVFNNGALAAEPEYVRNILIGGGRPAHNPRLVGNMTYFDTVKVSGENNVGHTAGCVNLWARGNYLIGGRPLIFGRCTTESFQGNTLYGRVWEVWAAEHGDNHYYTETPTDTRVFVRPNRCEQGRAHVAVYNWNALPRVSVDLSEAALVAGERFVVRDVQDYFGSPVAEGIYDGAPVSIPMQGLRAEPPVGNVHAPAHTGPRFGAFVVMQPDVAERAGAAVPAGCMPSDTAAPGNSPLEDLLKVLGG